MVIDHFNLRSFDLNLLVAFDALMLERSVTNAARRLRIQQPAMSHALSTLRVLLQDELFYRSGQTMQPTSRARSLAGPVRQLLQQAQSAVRHEQAFDPATASRSFRVAMSPEVEALLLPELIALNERTAPGVRIVSVPASGAAVEDMLEEGMLDLAVGCRPAPPDRTRESVLHPVEAVCCYNPDLIRLEAPISREAYLGAKHALASQDGSLQAYIQSALQTANLDLNVMMTPTSFISALAAAQVGPVIATVAAHVGERFGRPLGLEVSPVPFQLGLPPLLLRWAEYAGNDQENRWLREQVREATSRYEALL